MKDVKTKYFIAGDKSGYFIMYPEKIITCTLSGGKEFKRLFRRKIMYCKDSSKPIDISKLRLKDLKRHWNQVSIEEIIFF